MPDDVTGGGSAALRVEELGDRVVLRLARPALRNAIDQQIVTELPGACRLLEAQPRVALIIGEGGNFAAGADIAQLRARRSTDALRGMKTGEGFYQW
jgi:enoyl-CoA hydratase